MVEYFTKSMLERSDTVSVEVRNLRKTFGDFVAVDNLSFSLDKEGVFALLGTNGAGKTTTIRMILGMLEKDCGEVLFEGRPIDAVSDPIGYLAEERGLYPKVNVMEQLVYFATLRGMTRADALAGINYWLDRLEVGQYKDKKANQLSKGNQQKIQLISALVTEPQLLILDEPLSGLDPVNANQFREVIRDEVKKGKYIIMSSHQMSTIEEFCQDIVILNKGKAVLKGNLGEIKKSYGRVNLAVKSDDDISQIARRAGLVLKEKTPEESLFRVSGEEQARAFLADAVSCGASIVKFELTEPSLHEIFVEKVGEQNGL